MNVPKNTPINSSIFSDNMQHQFEFKKTFRYQEINSHPDVSKVLYALHGYGQLVDFFIRKFKDLPQDLLIVAPEGMHRFYINGTNGRVGASWMTKTERETDINDTIAYLDELDKQVSERYPISKRFLLGFSQGGATAARWEQLGTVKFDGVLLWACIFPPDLPLNDSKGLENSNHYFAIGTNDEFYEESAQQNLIEYYRSLGYDVVTYDGTHDLVNETLTEILRQMDSNS